MRAILMLLGCSVIGLASSALAQDRGLVTPSHALGGPFWQARFERDQSVSWLLARSTQGLVPLAQSQTLRLLGDYQFSALRLGETGGLRLTGGMLVNLRQDQGQGIVTADSAEALPYAGIGYASGSQRGAWGFSADVGLAAQGMSSLRLDRLFNGASGLSVDGAPRLLPMVRLGMTLAF